MPKTRMRSTGRTVKKSNYLSYLERDSNKNLIVKLDYCRSKLNWLKQQIK